MNDQSTEFEGAKIEVPKSPYPEILPAKIRTETGKALFKISFSTVSLG